MSLLASRASVDRAASIFARSFFLATPLKFAAFVMAAIQFRAAHCDKRLVAPQCE